MNNAGKRLQQAIPEIPQLATLGAVQSRALVVPLGAAILSTNTVAMPSALEADPGQNSPASSVQASFILATDHSDITDHQEANAGINGAVSGVQIGFDADYARTVQVDNYTLTAIFTILVLTGSKSFKNDYQLTKKAQGLAADPRAFANEYGDVFCAQQLYGGYLTGIGTYTSYSRTETDTLSASLTAGEVSFGGWGAVQHTVTSIQQKENFNFSFNWDGPPFGLKGNVLKDPDAFFNACNAWITAAMAYTPDTKPPIRQYFLPYSSVGLKKALPVNWDYYNQMLELEALANDRLARIADMAADKQQRYEPFDPKDLQAAQDTFNLFKKNVASSIAGFRKAPFDWDTKPIPKLPEVALPQFNPYSQVALFNHLNASGYAIITLDADVPTSINDTNNKHLVIQKGQPYKIFHMSVPAFQNAWVCIAPDNVPKAPNNFTLNTNCSPDVFWIWGQAFYYDNRGAVLHYPTATTGKIEVIDAKYHHRPPKK